MIFTYEHWQTLLRGEYAVSAAPIGPSELGRNSRYVFALPPRYNYAFPLGWEEVDHLISTQPLSTFEPVLTEADVALEACDAIPNGAVFEVVDTTRLFINLPKECHPDRDRNLQFTTLQGNATAGWVSNASPFGEAFGTPSSQCWSYYFQFNGSGQLELRAEGTAAAPEYKVKFVLARPDASAR